MPGNWSDSGVDSGNIFKYQRVVERQYKYCIPRAAQLQLSACSKGCNAMFAHKLFILAKCLANIEYVFVRTGKFYPCSESLAA
jgi:hypothetical protein